ncbi:MAG: hypothetical protein JW841_17075, partial [Deltaproteobacteria bacterium]|nr:hypothetical protein [Deltaproteobacteria bacterium]
MSIYLYLATSLFTRDKLAYIYDISASLTDNLAEQTRASFEASAETISVFTQNINSFAEDFSEREKLAQELFERKNELIRIEIYNSNYAKFKPRYTFVNTSALERLQIKTADLLEIRRLYPIPIKAIQLSSNDLYIQNSSLSPKAPIITIAINV